MRGDSATVWNALVTIFHYGYAHRRNRKLWIICIVICAAYIGDKWNKSAVAAAAIDTSAGFMMDTAISLTIPEPLHGFSRALVHSTYGVLGIRGTIQLAASTYTLPALYRLTTPHLPLLKLLGAHFVRVVKSLQQRATMAATTLLLLLLHYAVHTQRLFFGNPLHF
jgi:hypothetical protein